MEVGSQPVQRTTKRCPSKRPAWLLRTLTLGSRRSLGTQITASYMNSVTPCILLQIDFETVVVVFPYQFVMAYHKRSAGVQPNDTAG